MTLGELILELELMKIEFGEYHICTYGFGNPHSWRGSYNELCFEPIQHIAVHEMLTYAKSALNKYYEGWKGGLYKMDQFTPCHLQKEGSTSVDDNLTKAVLYVMRNINSWPSWEVLPSTRVAIFNAIPDNCVICPNCDGKIFVYADLCSTCDWRGYIESAVVVHKTEENNWEM